MVEYRLANGYILTDEEIERECEKWESGNWEGHLERIHQGHPPVSDEPLVPVTVKFPASMLAQIDAKAKNRSDYIRRVVAASL